MEGSIVGTHRVKLFEKHTDKDKQTRLKEFGEIRNSVKNREDYANEYKKTYCVEGYMLYV